MSVSFGSAKPCLAPSEKRHSLIREARCETEYENPPLGRAAPSRPPDRRPCATADNTSCVSVEIGEKLLIFDAGSGIRPLGNTLVNYPGEILIFLTHLHWDHIQGLLFFTPLYLPGRLLNLQTPERKMKSLEKIAGVDGLHFPLKPYQIGSVIAINRRDPVRELRAQGIRFRRKTVNHPGICDGFRLEYDGCVLVYIPDNEIDPPYPKKIDSGLACGVLSGCGRADPRCAVLCPAICPSNAAGDIAWSAKRAQLAQAAGVKQLVLFHHDPTRSDDVLDVIQQNSRQWFAAANSPVEVAVAAEGMEFVLEGNGAPQYSPEREFGECGQVSECGGEPIGLPDSF